MLNRILMAAVIVAALSGIVVTGLQMVWAAPLIQAAETFEKPDADAVRAAGDRQGERRTPGDGLARTFWTFVTNVLLGFGAALILLAAAAATGAGGPRTGLSWAVAGFLSFAVAPAIGLPPELPGTVAAGLAERQVWWFGTAAATLIGLGAIRFAREPLMRLGGAALLLLPHAIGAPRPEVHAATAPLALQQEFIAASLVTAAVFWMLVGLGSGYLSERFRLSEGRTAAAGDLGPTG